MQFKTRFTIGPQPTRHYDSSDKVDRLSYVDSTKQILRFMQSGYNLQMSRAQAMYNDYKELHGDDPVPASLVYPEDIATMSEKLRALKEYAYQKTKNVSDVH